MADSSKDIVGSVTARSGANRVHGAGAFDIRNVIGGLLLIYGVILVVTGIIANKDNLWAGLGLVVVGAIFVTWAVARPVKVPEEPTSDDASAADPR